MDKRPALGKGLSALIPDSPEPSLSPIEVDIDRRLTPTQEDSGCAAGKEHMPGGGCFTTERAHQRTNPLGIG